MPSNAVVVLLLSGRDRPLFWGPVDSPPRIAGCLCLQLHCQLVCQDLDADDVIADQVSVTTFCRASSRLKILLFIAVDSGSFENFNAFFNVLELNDPNGTIHD
jgi:hypothetical protein